MLPFTGDILFSNIEQYYGATWPAPVVALVLAIASVLLAFVPVRGASRAAGALLGIGWIWTGLAYHVLHFAQINFTAPIYGAFFVLQGLLLLWSVTLRRAAVLCFLGGGFAWIGLLLAAVAIFIYPLVDWLAGQPWQGGRLALATPAPTTLLTLGLLLTVKGRTPIHLFVIPFLWALVSGATAWILDIPQDLGLPVLAAGALLLGFLKNREAQA